MKGCSSLEMMVREGLVVPTGAINLQYLCQAEPRAGAAAAPGKSKELRALPSARSWRLQGPVSSSLARDNLPLAM